MRYKLIHWPESQIYMDLEKYPRSEYLLDDLNEPCGSVFVPVEYLPNSNNQKISDMIEERLDEGAKQYGQQVPLDNSRNHTRDALEEILDMAVYIAAKLIEIEEKNDSNT